MRWHAILLFGAAAEVFVSSPRSWAAGALLTLGDVLGHPQQTGARGERQEPSQPGTLHRLHQTVMRRMPVTKH